MEILAAILALTASFVWATASLVAFNPVKKFGTFDFVRIQLPTATLLLAVITTFLGTWDTIVWSYWPNLILSSVVGILIGDLALHKCLEYGGPRRMQVLFSLNAPITGIFGYLFFSEVLSMLQVVGFILVSLGVIGAIWFTKSNKDDQLEVTKSSLPLIAFWGGAAALCQAIGLLSMKPVIMMGAEPFAASAVRMGGGAIILSLSFFIPGYHSFKKYRENKPLAIQAICSGWMGYVLAMTLLLFALKHSSTGIVAVLASTVPIMMLPIIWITTKKRPSKTAWLSALTVVIGTAFILH